LKRKGRPSAGGDGEDDDWDVKRQSAKKVKKYNYKSNASLHADNVLKKFSMLMERNNGQSPPVEAVEEILKGCDVDQFDIIGLKGALLKMRLAMKADDDSKIDEIARLKTRENAS